MFSTDSNAAFLAMWRPGQADDTKPDTDRKVCQAGGWRGGVGVRRRQPCRLLRTAENTEGGVGGVYIALVNAYWSVPDTCNVVTTFGTLRVLSCRGSIH